MNNIQIRLSHTDSVNSVDKQNFLDVELENTSKLMHYTDVKKTIDQFEQFKSERSKCDRYRLILTINPYCTNVLFNTFTEMVYAEGSDKCEAIVENEDISENVNKDCIYYSDATNPDRITMLMNTEFSRPGSAKNSKDVNEREITNEYYEYHPGYDIFDNHILRNKTFKIVNVPRRNDNKVGFGCGDNLFNTLFDKQRNADGTQVTYKRRTKINDSNLNTSASSLDRHLYDHDDVLEYRNGDVINANLTEENGWYGFINNSTIQSRDMDRTTKEFVELNIGRVLNNRKSCEFIDMYPDRTLYSFNPKYNKYRHREEYNWEVILTYPYSKTNEDKYEIVKDLDVIVDTIKKKEGETETTEYVKVKRNGLIILSATKTIGPGGDTVILFRSLTKHGLKRGDNVRFYYTADVTENDETHKEWFQYTKDFTVRNVGNLENNEKEYYFYISDMDFIRLLDKSLDDISDSGLEVDMTREYRFSRLAGGMPSKYYIRKFKKVPNFKYSKMNFPDDGSMTIDEYIEENAKKNDKMVLFDKEQYKLAFESTIYNDDSTQITFTDTVDIENLVDDRGCPLTELYFTIVKTNYGHDKWFKNSENASTIITDRQQSEVEFSHCFGKIMEGLQFSQTKDDRYRAYLKGETEEEDESISHKRHLLGDICMIFDANNPEELNTPYNGDIDIRTMDEFMGDIVDFNPNECIEKPLQSFMHRFNTVQREINWQGNGMESVTYHEIWADDWDANPVNVKNPIGAMSNQPFCGVAETAGDGLATNRREGYYYQPHYRIPLRQFGNIQQDQHIDINISKIEPVQSDALYIRITTKRRSGASKGDIVYLFDEKNDKIYEFVVTYVENRVSFLIMPYIKEKGNPWKSFTDKTQMNWLDLCNLAMPREDGTAPELYFKIKNNAIPPYAEKVGKNKYLWREVLRAGDEGAEDLEEYQFANNAFYITKELNFFLKRQDPQNWNGLYCEYGFPNDISGNIKHESNYIYKQEKDIIC